MKKETLTLQNVKNDLRRVAQYNISNAEEWRLSYIIPITLLAVSLGVLLERIWVGLIIILFALPHVYFYVVEIKGYKKKKRALVSAMDRGDVSVSVETLSHIAEETIYEPHSHGRKNHSTKTATFFHFMSGGSWRLPRVLEHYAWSKDFRLSRKGLKNTSVQGDEFFRISLQGYLDVAYIYPCKFFELGSDFEQEKQ